MILKCVNYTVLMFSVASKVHFQGKPKKSSSGEQTLLSKPDFSPFKFNLDILLVQRKKIASPIQALGAHKVRKHCTNFQTIDAPTSSSSVFLQPHIYFFVIIAIALRTQQNNGRTKEN